MCMLLPSGETRNYISAQKERSRLRDCSPLLSSACALSLKEFSLQTHILAQLAVHTVTSGAVHAVVLVVGFLIY